MKTSNKLLLSFAGLIVLLMLLSDTVIWANYKRGRSGDGLLTDNDNDNGQRRSIAIGQFKVIKIQGRGPDKLGIQKDEKFQISYWSDQEQQFLYSTQNDTLFITLRKDDHFTVRCPSVHTVILSETGGVSIRDFQTPEIHVSGTDSSEIELVNNKVGILDVTAGVASNFTNTGDESSIDSIHLELGRGSRLKSFNIPYRGVSMKVDSLEELLLEGRSLSSLKQIR